MASWIPHLRHATSAPRKMAINYAIARHLTDTCPSTHPTVFVIDDPDTGCRSSAALLHTHPHAKIYACSTNPEIENVCGVVPLHCVSTHALDEVAATGDKLDAVFLDYCQTPNRTFEWVDDVRLALTLLRHPTCPIYLTFARRQLPNTSTFVHVALRDELPTVCVRDIYEYKESRRTPMVLYTIFAHAVAFTVTPLTAYLILSKGQQVTVRGLGHEAAWKGVVHRRLSNTVLEVRALPMGLLFTVDLSDIIQQGPPIQLAPRVRNPARTRAGRVPGPIQPPANSATQAVRMGQSVHMRKYKKRYIRMYIRMCKRKASALGTLGSTTKSVAPGGAPENCVPPASLSKSDLE